MGIPEVVPHYQVIVKREGTLDEVEVKVEVIEDVIRQLAQEVLSEDIVEANAQMRSLRSTIQQAIRGTIGLNMKITLVAPNTIPRSEGGKLRRVVDERTTGLC